MRLIQRIAKFVTGVTLPSVAGEVAILCCTPSSIAPEETGKHLVDPLLASIERELPTLKAAAESGDSFNISKVCLVFRRPASTWPLHLTCKDSNYMRRSLAPAQSQHTLQWSEVALHIENLNGQTPLAGLVKALSRFCLWQNVIASYYPGVSLNPLSI